MTTTKYVFNEGTGSLHRVVGYEQPWEELGPGVRVRRRIVRPLTPFESAELLAWFAMFIDGTVDEHLYD
ncbi:MAG: hypothetical protein AAGF11_45845 [Myxococcota bacterium]